METYGTPGSNEARLRTRITGGLSKTDAEECLIKHGPNAVALEKQRGWLWRLFKAMLYLFGCWHPSRAPVFQTGWFVESLITQTPPFFAFVIPENNCNSSGNV